MFKSIPTLGPKGVRFRSRIEATWAHFFDNLGWEWEYEFGDLDGYIPDFIVTFPEKTIAFEVKSDGDFAKLSTYTEKIVNSGWKSDFVVVGGKLFANKSIEKKIPIDPTSKLLGLLNGKHPVILHKSTEGVYSINYWNGDVFIDIRTDQPVATGVVFEDPDDYLLKLFSSCRNKAQYKAPIESSKRDAYYSQLIQKEKKRSTMVKVIKQDIVERLRCKLIKEHKCEDVVVNSQDEDGVEFAIFTVDEGCQTEVFKKKDIQKLTADIYEYRECILLGLPTVLLVPGKP